MNMTVKELAAELNVSKQTIHRTIQKRNIVTIADGNRVLLDDTAQKAIKENLQDRMSQNESSADVSRTFSDGAGNDTERHADGAADDLRTEYIETLKQQIEDLKADKQFLQNRLAAAEAERDNLTKERQTILAELLSLRGQPKITTTTAAETKPASAPKPERQVKPVLKRRRTLSDRIRDFFK